MIDDTVLERTLHDRAAQRWRLRRGLRRGPAHHHGAPRRRQGRGDRVGTRTRRRDPRRSAARRPGSHTPPISARRACATRPRPRRPRRGSDAGTTNVVALGPRHATRRVRTRCEVLPESVDKARKGDLLDRADDAARAEGDTIRQVSASYADARRRILVANSDGLLAERRPGAHTILRAVRRRRATPGCRPVPRRRGARSASSSSTRSQPEAVARIAAQRAVTMLRRAPGAVGQAARRAQAGRRRCAVPRGVRTRARSRSRGTRRVGLRGSGRGAGRVAARHVGRRRHATRASGAPYAIDDEGTPAQRNVLIENGVLTDYMWDLVRARKDGRISSGQRSPRDVPAPARWCG